LGGDFEITVRRAKAFDTLVGPFVVVVFDPEFDALAGRLEALELGPGQKLLPDRSPEAFDLAQGHGVMGPAFEVGHAILLQLGLETAGAPPGGVLAAVVGEHFLGRRELGRGDPIDFDDGLGGGTAEEVGADHETRVIVQETDQVGIAAAQSEREDITLPHLIGCGPLEEARSRKIAPRPGRAADQALFSEPGPDGLGAGTQHQPPPQPLGNALDPKGGVLGFDLEYLLTDGRRQLGAGWSRRQISQPRFPELSIAGRPAQDCLGGDAHLLGDHRQAESFFEAQLDGSQFEVGRVAARSFFAARTPPRGGGPLLLYLFILFHVDTSLSLKCQPISDKIRSH
jgi:hypothetical protein